MKPKRAVLTHMHVDLDYERLKAELPEGVEPAYDGMVLTGRRVGDLQLDGLPGFGEIGHGEGNEPSATSSGVGSFDWSSPGKASARMRVAVAPGSIRFTLIALSLVSLA